MVQSRRLVGGAGTGKTWTLMQLLEQLLQYLGDVRKIGFCSFSRAARAEAVSRACSQFGFDPEVLRREGWFRTLHSICYQLVEAKGGQLIVSGTKEGQKWLETHLQVRLTSMIDDDTGVHTFVGDSLEATALNLWDRARNSLRTLEDICLEDASIYSDTPHYVDIKPIIERYESAKRIDGRVDFTDLLLRFAGLTASTGGYGKCTPAGEVPACEVWLVDEAQDLSPLTAKIVERLAAAPECRYLYLVGDPFQSIYGFAGATPKPFMEWKVEKQRVMPRSFRCPAVISDLGERILSGCSDYWQRGIEPAGHGGEVGDIDVEELSSVVEAEADWLLLARTHFQANKLRAILDAADIPHRSTKSDTVTEARRGLRCLWQLEQGQRVDPVEFAYALKLIPSQGLLEWGAKSKYDPGAFTDLHVTTLGSAGCKEELKTAVFSGEWASLVDGGTRFRDWADRHGVETAAMPRVRVGTIHSVKGAEAENVMVLNASCARFDTGAQASTARLDEELRLAYVAVTRAKRRLIVASDAQTKFTLQGI